jgi:hypothetical protein
MASDYIGLERSLSLALFIIQGCGESVYPTNYNHESALVDVSTRMS